MTCHYWISKLLWQKVKLVDTVIVRDCFPPLGEARENLMNYPCPEKFQPTCQSSRRGKWDAFIAKMKAQITKCLCPVRHVTCTYALSFLKHHTLHTILKTKYSCVDCLVSFYHKYLVFHVVEYIPAYFKLDKECIDSIAVILKTYL